MRALSERDQCQAKLDILVEGFMGDDWGAYREACAWLCDFADQKNTQRDRLMRGGRWFTPQAIESVTERARSAAARKRTAPPDAVACPNSGGTHSTPLVVRRTRTAGSGGCSFRAAPTRPAAVADAWSWSPEGGGCGP